MRQNEFYNLYHMLVRRFENRAVIRFTSLGRNDCCTANVCDNIRKRDPNRRMKVNTKRQKNTGSGMWQTKFGPRRVRRDPPTVIEAVAAARGLTEDLAQQIEIAAALMDLPPDVVRPEVLKAAAAKAEQKNARTVAFVGRAGAPRAVVVERKARRSVLGKGTGRR